ncbi:hypothetical protein QR680_001835 [Steinernema hermaphroditum]|uniref:Transmembrane protein 218 n=1 Tax=Steinernema hermaphroditum TaxID=289476 RepID=A0AA39H033_9BILA|nr:hypothetical protein QR680_001835 [Steinernema hermaphroditum]
MSVGFAILILIWSSFLFAFVILGKYFGVPGVLASIAIAVSLTALLLAWPRYAANNSAAAENDNYVADEIAWPRVLLLITISIVTLIAIARSVHHSLLANARNPIRLSKRSNHFTTFTN